MRRRFRRRWLIPVALLLLVLIPAALLLLASSRLDGWASSWIRQRVDALGGEIEWDQLSLRPTLGEIEVAGLRLRIPVDEASSVELDLPLGQFELSVPALVRTMLGRPQFSDVRLIEPTLRLSRNERGTATRVVDTDRRFALRVDRLHIERGSLELHDRVMPLELTAEALEVDAHRPRSSRSTDGTLEAQLIIERDPLRQPLPLHVWSAFHWREHDLQFEGVRVSGPGLTLGGDGRVGLLGAADTVARGSFEADLDEIRPWLPEGTPTLHGTVLANGSLEIVGGEPRIRGTLQSSALRIDELRAVDVDATALLSPGRLDLLDLDLEALGGRAAGALSFELDSTTRFNGRLDIDGIQTAQLFRWLDVPLPLAARLDGELELDGVPDRLGSWTATARFEASSTDEYVGLAIDGPGLATLSEGRLNVSMDRARVAAAELDLDAGLDIGGGGGPLEVSLVGHTDDIGATRDGALVVLEALGRSPSELLRRPVAGHGSLAARVGVEGGVTNTTLSLDLEQPELAGHRFDRGSLRLASDGTSVQVEAFRLRRGQSRLEGAATARLDPPAVLGGHLKARAFDPLVVGEFFGIPGIPSGMLDGSIVLEKESSAPASRGAGWVTLRDGTWQGEAIEHAELRFDVDPDRVRLKEFSASGPAFSVSGYGRWPLDGSPARLALRDGVVDLGRLNARPEGEPSISGVAALDGLLHVDRGEWDLALRVGGDDWRVAETALGAVDGRLQVDAQRAILRMTSRGEGWEAATSVGLSDGLPFDTVLRLERTPVPLPLMDLDARAVIDGAIRVSGMAERPSESTVDATIDALDLALGGKRLRGVGPLAIRLAAGRIELPEIRLEGPESSFVTSGVLDLGGDELDLTIQGRVGLGVLAAPLEELRAAGAADFAFRVRGALDAPRVEGTLRVDDGRLRWLGFPHGLDRLEVDLSVTENELNVAHARARLGNGELLAEGSATLANLVPERYDARVRATNVRLEFPDDFRGVYEGELAVEGQGAAALVSGDVRLIHGLYDRSFDLLQLTGFGTREYESTDASALPDEIRLDLTLSADDNVWVRNDLAEIESRVTLGIAGSLRRPEVTGRIEILPESQITFRDVEYSIDSGAVDLVDAQRLDPFLTLRARTEIREYTVFLRVEGTLDRFEYELTSQPTLTTQDIIALLTTGNTLQELAADGGGGEFTGDLAANYFAGALTDRFERQLRGLLGFERIQINPLLVGGDADPTSRVTLGKRVTRDLFVVFSKDFGGAERQLYEVEWRANRNFRLGAKRDTLGGIGGEVRYTDQFWWHDRDARPEPEPDPDRADIDRSVVGTVEGRRVRQVTVRGLDEERRPEIEQRIELRPGQRFTRARMFAGVEAIRRAMVKRQRLEAIVDAKTAAVDGDTEVDVVYLVRPGPIVRLEFEGTEGRERRRLREMLETLWIETVDPDVIWDDTATEVGEWFRDRGFYAVDVVLDQELVDDERRITIRVDRGPPVRVERVLLDGVVQVDESRVRRQLLTRPSSLFSRTTLSVDVLEQDLVAIRNLYRDLGFLDVAIDRPTIRLTTAGDRAVIGLRIDEGRRSTIGSIEIPPVDELDPSRLLAAAALRSGEVFSPSRLLRAESELRAVLDAEGWPDARVVGKVDRAGSVVDLRFEIDSGLRKRVAETAVLGNTLTHHRVIRRELALGAGDVLSRDGVLRTQHRLYRLGIFRNVKLSAVPIEGDDPEAHRLEVLVDEAPPFTTSLGIGYDSEAGGRVSFSLGHANVGGWDRDVAIQGRFSTLEERLQLVVKEPRLFGSRLPTLFDLLDERREEVGFTVERRAIAVRIDREIAPKWDGYARYGFQRVDLERVVGGDPPDETELGDFGLAFVRDTRDDPFLTRQGSFLSFGAQVFARPLLSEESFVKHASQFAHVHGFGRGLTSASSIRLGLAWPFSGTQTVPTSERFFAGGDSTLRGFARDVVGPQIDGEPLGGEARLLFNQELRFPIWNSLRGVLFYDGGNVWKDAADLDPSDLRHVLGTGLRFETPIGPLRLEYGRKLDREPGESIGELFVAIGAAF